MWKGATITKRLVLAGLECNRERHTQTMEGIITRGTVFEGPSQGKPGKEFIRIKVKAAVGAHMTKVLNTTPHE